MEAGKLALMYVSGGGWRECFGRSLAQFLLVDAKERQIVDGLAWGNGLYVDHNRNRAVEMFLSGDAEWALNFDTDISFDWSVPYRLLDEAHPTLRPIVSALYVGKIVGLDGGPPVLVPMFYRRKPSGAYHTVGELHNSAQEIDGMGMGCTIIHRSVFEGIPDNGTSRRWFACEDHQIEGMGTTQFVGEDLVFCERAQAAGFRIYGDSRIQVGHDKSELLTVEDLIRSAKR